MEYVTIQEDAEKREMTSRRIQVLCPERRVDGAIKLRRQWAIPTDCAKSNETRK